MEDSDGALLGPHVREENIALFGRTTWLNYSNEKIELIKMKRIFLALLISFIKCGVYHSFNFLSG